MIIINLAFFLFGFFTAVMLGFIIGIKKKETIRKERLNRLKGKKGVKRK